MCNSEFKCITLKFGTKPSPKWTFRIISAVNMKKHKTKRTQKTRKSTQINPQNKQKPAKIHKSWISLLLAFQHFA